MNYAARQTSRLRRVASIAIIVALLVCIFVVDTITNFEIAIAVFYVAVILVAITLLPRRDVIVLAFVCVGLTVVSFALTPSGAREAGLINAAISISAISTTTYLALKMIAAETAVHESRAQLARMAHLTTLGELTASIAHEINQPLAAIMTSANACQRWLDIEPPNLDKARASVERVIGDTNRASEVIARVRDLAKGKTPREEWLSLNDVIEEAASLARTEIDGRGISLHISLASGPPVLADKVQLLQVITNLILNAIEAMDDVSPDARKLEICSRADAGGVVVTIADTGVGLGSDACDHLFDAFWTTKEHGLGIGLAISRSIVEAHGGHIWATPNSGTGATFQFSLPAVRGHSR
jgi:C4-dicarboxylate-specific signal transduction histidine kinase